MGHLGHVQRTLRTLECEAEVLEILPYGSLWHQKRGYQGDSVLGQYVGARARERCFSPARRRRSGPVPDETIQWF